MGDFFDTLVYTFTGKVPKVARAADDLPDAGEVARRAVAADAAARARIDALRSPTPGSAGISDGSAERDTAKAVQAAIAAKRAAAENLNYAGGVKPGMAGGLRALKEDRYGDYLTRSGQSAPGASIPRAQIADDTVSPLYQSKKNPTSEPSGLSPMTDAERAEDEARAARAAIAATPRSKLTSTVSPSTTIKIGDSG